MRVLLTPPLEGEGFNARASDSSPFKGEVGWGMGLLAHIATTTANTPPVASAISTSRSRGFVFLGEGLDGRA